MDAKISENRFSRFDEELIDTYFNEAGKAAIEAYIAKRCAAAQQGLLKELEIAAPHDRGVCVDYLTVPDARSIKNNGFNQANKIWRGMLASRKLQD